MEGGTDRGRAGGKEGSRGRERTREGRRVGGTESQRDIGSKSTFNPLRSEGHFCGQVNQSVRYVHSHPKFAK